MTGLYSSSVKTAISLPDDTFQRVEAAAKRLGVSRSEFFARAAEHNRSDLRTVTVAVLTTDMQLAALPGNVAVPADVDAVETDSVVSVTQIATVDRRALENRVGALPDWLMAHVDAGLCRALAITYLRRP